MAARHEITGIWRGTYFFDLPEMRHPDGNGVGFEMRIRQNRWQRLLGLFEGGVHDDPVRGVPGQGQIRGRIRGSLITFTKRLPEFYVGGFKPLSLRDHLRKDDHELRREVAHPPIYYAGVSDENGVVTGTWEMCALTLPLDANGAELKWPRSTGTFSMSRVNSGFMGLSPTIQMPEKEGAGGSS